MKAWYHLTSPWSGARTQQSYQWHNAWQVCSYKMSPILNHLIHILARKSPKSPFGGILPKPLIECCRGSNSVWKTGITSFIRLTQSKLRSVLRKWESWKTRDFELVHLRTGSTELSLRYQFSTQNLTLYNIQLMALVKFRQMAILAIFGGDFGDFLARILIECFKIGLIL